MIEKNIILGQLVFVFRLVIKAININVDVVSSLNDE